LIEASTGNILASSKTSVFFKADILKSNFFVSDTNPPSLILHGTTRAPVNGLAVFVVSLVYNKTASSLDTQWVQRMNTEFFPQYESYYQQSYFDEESATLYSAINAYTSTDVGILLSSFETSNNG
jgi:hypothetical protein